jgi:hypothetical protein
MAKEADHLAGTVGKDKAGGTLLRLVADENEFDRRALWRLGTWAATAVGAVIVAMLANQSSIGLRRQQTAATDLAREARELQSLTRESQSETRRLASAVDTLNSDRDRLYSRVTVLEQGLETVTGALARQTAASTPVAPQAAAPTSTAAPASTNVPADPPAAMAALTAQAASPPPTIAPVATTAAALTERPKPEKREKSETAAPTPAQGPSPTPPQDQAAAPAASSLPKIASTVPAPSAPATAVSSLLPPKSLMAPPDPAASKLEPAKDPAKAPANPTPAASPETAAAQPAAGDSDAASDSVSAKVERTEFAVDLGAANSVGGLRALWRGLVKSNADLATLKPIIVIKERSNGLGMQLRLAAGPLMDAAAAAKICAALAENERGCETTLFDGQRLALGNEDADKSPVPAPAQKAAPAARGRHSLQKHSRRDDPPPPPKPEPSTLSSFFGRK